LDSLLVSVDAFDPTSEGITSFQSKRMLLEEGSTQATSKITDRDFEGVKAPIANAEDVRAEL
jgi:hypothetical protein